MLIEFGDNEIHLMDKIIEILKENADFKVMCVSDQHVISISGLEIHHEYKKVYCYKQEVFLTAREYILLYLLATNKGQVLTYDRIYSRVWGEDAFGNVNNNIACHISRLRQKVCRLLPQESLSIKCVSKVGYILIAN